jgi:hypothetical protein
LVSFSLSLSLSCLSFTMFSDSRLLTWHAGKHRDLQRITVPYARLLGIVTEGQRGDDQAMITDM